MTAGTVKKSPVIVVKKKRQFTLSPAPVTENVAATPAPASDAEKITAPVTESPAEGAEQLPSPPSTLYTILCKRLFSEVTVQAVTELD
ncbi:hypothetical protein GQ105_005473, partial [Salmonella enterica]|nr:hypothetical protein [Salmonella enterica]